MTEREARRIRIKACECAAHALAGRQQDENFAPLAWSLSVFFEMYIREGCEGTRKEFGPKKPTKMKAVK